jgi:AcrR family transcriptional regulator
MAGERTGVRLRLRNAALDLYSERGFDKTTAAEIAALAGVTERSYFRHFADKREVLFDGEAAMEASLVDAVANAPAGLPPLPALLEAFLSVVPLFESDRALKERRHRVISATPELRERELAKVAHLTAAVTAALEQRDVPGSIASLAAFCGIAVLLRARLEWLAGSPRGYPALFTEAFADLASLFDLGDEQQLPWRFRQPPRDAT